MYKPIFKENFYTGVKVYHPYTGDSSYVEIFDDISKKDLMQIPSWKLKKEFRGVLRLIDSKHYIWDSNEMHEYVIPEAFPDDDVIADFVRFDGNFEDNTVKILASWTEDDDIDNPEKLRLELKFKHALGDIKVKFLEKVNKMQTYVRYFETEALPKRAILRIKDPTLYTIADRLLSLGTLNPTTNFKIIKKLNDNKLLQFLTKKNGKDFQILMGVRDFTLQDIINFDKKLQTQPPKYTGPEGEANPDHDFSIFKDPQVLKRITKDLSTWTGAQRFITNLDNHVLQFNIDWDWLKDYLKELDDYGTDLHLDHSSNEILNYIKNSNHPTSRTKLTLGWCRFTLLKPGLIQEGQWKQTPEDIDKEVWKKTTHNVLFIEEKSVILDEIQTDMNDDRFLSESLMQGWEVYMMQKFIYFIRGSLKVRRIYMPNYETKQNAYGASPPMSLYKELPNKFGFKKDSDFKGFMLLENLSRK